jgi:chemotaxis protein MotB
MSEKKDTSQLWMVPYADLMSCMVILFFALYGFSYNMKGTEYEKALAQMQKELGMKHAAEKLKELDAATKVEEDLKDQIKEGSLGVEVTTSRIKLTFASPVLFDSGSAELKSTARSVLDPVAESLLKMENQVVVEGHTDSARMLGKKFSSNRELSLMRAFSVIDRPAAANDTDENRARNRRIEMIIMRQAQAGEKSS